MNVARTTATTLRTRILRALHVGQLKPGDRLPSSRAIAGQLDADHRSVAHAYRILAEEGLVAVRPRSGVFVAHHEHFGEGGHMPAATVRWIRDVAAEGWLLQTPVTKLPELLNRCLGPRPLKCVFIESVTDAAAAISTELARGLGLPVEAVLLPGSAPECDEAEGPGTSDFAEQLRAADLLLTTVFHVGAIETSLSRLSIERPLVVVSICPDWGSPFKEAMRKGGLTVIHVDRGAPERFRMLLDPTGHECLRFLAVDELGEAGAAAVEGALHLTVAAQRLLDSEDLDLVRPAGSILSVETVRDVVEAVIRLNLKMDEG